MSKEYYYKKSESWRYSVGETTMYAKVIKHEFFGEETCQTISFWLPDKEHHFIVGDEYFQGVGFLDTNKYSYYCDLGEEITKEEYVEALKEFMLKLNEYVSKAIY